MTNQFQPHSEHPWEGWRIVTADPAKLEAICKQPLHPEIFDVKPFGNRLVMVREAPKAFSGTCQSCGRRNLTADPGGKCAYCGKPGLVSLELPQQARDLPSVGWVVSAGPEAAVPNWPRSLPLQQEQLVGCKLLFAPYGGHTLTVGEVGETMYSGRYLLIEATQVLGMVGTQPEEPPL